MSGLDFDAPHGIVYDMPGVRYQQHGVYYRNDGSPVDPPAERAEGPETSQAKVTNNGWTEDDLRRPENKALKAQLGVYNEPWTTRRAALEFLERGRG